MIQEEYNNGNIMHDIIMHNSQYNKCKVLKFVCIQYITELISDPNATLEIKQKLQSIIDKIYK